MADWVTESLRRLGVDPDQLDPGVVEALRVAAAEDRDLTQRQVARLDETQRALFEGFRDRGLSDRSALEATLGRNTAGGDVHDSLVEGFMRRGLTEAQAEQAAAGGRTSGHEQRVRLAEAATEGRTQTSGDPPPAVGPDGRWSLREFSRVREGYERQGMGALEALRAAEADERRAIEARRSRRTEIREVR